MTIPHTNANCFCFLCYTSRRLSAASLPPMVKKQSEDLVVIVQCAVYFVKWQGKLGSGEAIWLSRAVRQNAFMAPAGAAFCDSDSFSSPSPSSIHQPSGRCTEHSHSPFVNAHQKLLHSHYMPADPFEARNKLWGCCIRMSQRIKMLSVS